MRLSIPRVPALTPQQWSAAATEIMAPLVTHGRDLNIFRTLANHPTLMRRWLVFTNYILFKSTLPARVREFLILRIGFLCGSDYEWGQHVLIARAAGLTDDDFRAIQTGPGASGLGDIDRSVLQAADELHTDNFITDATWQALVAHFTNEQLMDIVFTVGQYKLVSMMLNTFGVQLDPGLPGFDL